jgi:hypothetical protein
MTGWTKAYDPNSAQAVNPVRARMPKVAKSMGKFSVRESLAGLGSLGLSSSTVGPLCTATGDWPVRSSDTQQLSSSSGIDLTVLAFELVALGAE